MSFIPAELEPKLLAVIREGYTRKDLVRDGLAGVVVGIVALPLAIAFAIASGVRPEQGLYTAIVAGFLISVVAYNMSEWRLFLGLLHGPRSDVMVLLSTFGLTVLVDLTVAIQVGVVLAALLFMRRMAEVSEVRSITEQLRGEDVADTEEPRVDLPEGVEVFEVAGSFFFGAAQKFSETIGEVRRRPSAVILRMRYVMAMDATGLRALEEVFVRFQRQGTRLVLSGVQEQPRRVLERSGLLERLGTDNVLPSFPEAVRRVRDVGAVPQ